MIEEKQEIHKLIELSKATWIKQNRNKDIPTHIVIKVTPRCNLNCIYCYSSNNEMTYSCIDPYIVESLFDQLFEVGNKYYVKCVFHGGEPMLYMETVEKIISILKSKFYNERIQFTMQTNGTLISESNIDFIAENFKSIGISLDGIEGINDRTRFYQDNRGSFNQVAKSIDLLNQHGVGYGVLAVATSKNINHFVEMVKWCSEHNIDTIGIEPLLFSGRGSMCHHLDISAELYWKEMKKLLDYILHHNRQLSFEKRIFIRDFETVAKKILGQRCTYMCAEVPCGAGTEHISLNYDGNVYICDTFIDQKEYCIGNISTKKLTDMFNAPIVHDFKSRKVADNEKCNLCSMKEFCLLGCIGKTILGNGITDLNAVSPLCYYYYHLASYIEELITQKQVESELLIK